MLPYADRGGTERHVATLSAAQRDRGDAVAILTPQGPGLALLPDLPVRHFPQLDQGGAPRAFRRALRRAVAELSPDVVHLHAAPELALLSTFVWRCPPRVLTLHGFPGREGAYRTAARLGRLARRIICVSRAEAARLGNGLGVQSRVRVVYNGVPDPPRDGRSFRELLPPAAAGARLIVTMARLEPFKGIQDLIAAFGQLALDFPDVRLVIAGVGSAREELEQRAQAMEARDRIHFLGFIPDAAARLPGATVFCLPSHEDAGEAGPLVFSEAMACAVPVISTALPGLSEIVDEGVTGMLVPPRRPEALAAALRRVLETPALAAGMGAAGRARYEERFTLSRQVDATAAVYRELISR